MELYSKFHGGYRTIVIEVKHHFACMVQNMANGKVRTIRKKAFKPTSENSRINALNFVMDAYNGRK